MIAAGVVVGPSDGWGGRQEGTPDRRKYTISQSRSDSPRSITSSGLSPPKAGFGRSLAALKNLTSELIGRFARAAQEATRDSYGAEALAGHTAGLVVPSAVRVEVEVLKAVADRYVMSRDDATRRYAVQTELVAELVHVLLEQAPAALDPILRDDWAAAREYCEALTVGSRVWRLPSTGELLDIYDASTPTPAGLKLKPPFHAGVTGRWVWSEDAGEPGSRPPGR